jgi:hypothetical protein
LAARPQRQATAVIKHVQKERKGEKERQKRGRRESRKERRNDYTYMMALEPFSHKLRTSLVWLRIRAGAIPGLYGENVMYTAPSVICTSTLMPPYWKQEDVSPTATTKEQTQE